MNFFKPKDPSAAAPGPPSPPSQHLLQQALTSLQTHFSDFFHTSQSKPPPPPKSTSFARISNEENPLHSKFNVNSSNNNYNPAAKNCAMSAKAIEERLSGVPVYALTIGSEEFALLSARNTGKNMGLLYFSKDDAENLLKEMKSIDPSMSSDSQVVAVALNKVPQLKVDGVAFRLMPEASQIRNALNERKKAGNQDESFRGVPVFQSKSLILKSQNKRFRPVFFRKEDLEKSLLRASIDQRTLNPSLRQGDIQVDGLEDIIQGMKDSSESSWNDVIFIPPGFDVSTDPSRQ